MFKPGDLAIATPRWHGAYPLEDADGRRLSGRMFEPNELTNTVVEIIQMIFKLHPDHDVYRVFYPALNGYARYAAKDLHSITT